MAKKNLYEQVIKGKCRASDIVYHYGEKLPGVSQKQHDEAFVPGLAQGLTGLTVAECDRSHWVVYRKITRGVK